MVTYKKSDIEAAYLAGISKGKRKALQIIEEDIKGREKRVRSFENISQLNAYIKGVNVCEREILAIIEKEIEKL